MLSYANKDEQDDYQAWYNHRTPGISPLRLVEVEGKGDRSSLP
ncbi:hypothetical protein VB711_22445 [Cronbergia sp. UHCC 0137]|nr:hypothetical protein [Cronbergia sp. UHCC 0137]MEA5620577.1 hypothetical protein [Cronbergia sp. UHCC 0137]